MVDGTAWRRGPPGIERLPHGKITLAECKIEGITGEDGVSAAVLAVDAEAKLPLIFAAGENLNLHQLPCRLPGRHAVASWCENRHGARCWPGSGVKGEGPVDGAAGGVGGLVPVRMGTCLE